MVDEKIDFVLCLDPKLATAVMTRLFSRFFPVVDEKIDFVLCLDPKLAIAIMT